MIEQAFQMLAGNVRGLQIDEALFVPPGGYRSTLGTLKHIAGWSHIYRSYAFEAEPRHWEHIDSAARLARHGRAEPELPQRGHRLGSGCAHQLAAVSR